MCLTYWGPLKFIQPIGLLTNLKESFAAFPMAIIANIVIRRHSQLEYVDNFSDFFYKKNSFFEKKSKL